MNSPAQQHQDVKPLKKVWQKPDFQILATDDINTGKAHPSVNEATAHFTGVDTWGTVNFNAGHFFHGTKYEAIS